MKIKECYNCGKEILDEYYRTKSRHIYCDECYHEEFERTCTICEDYFEKPSTPRGNYVYLHEETDGYTPGFYKVISFPLYTSGIIEGWINQGAMRLESKNVAYSQNGYGTGCKIDASGFICRDCFKEKGISVWRIEKHISSFINEEYERIGKPQNWTRIIVSVSRKYFDVLKEGKFSLKKVKIKLNPKNKLQELSADFYFRVTTKQLTT